MIVIICAKYKKNPSRTINVTERTRFSKSRPNDLEDIGQGQGSSHATHPLMLLIICTKYWKNPSWTVDGTGRTRKVNGQTDRQTDVQTDRRTDRQTGWIQYTPPPPHFVVGGINTLCIFYGIYYTEQGKLLDWSINFLSHWLFWSMAPTIRGVRRDRYRLNFLSKNGAFPNRSHACHRVQSDGKSWWWILY